LQPLIFLSRVADPHHFNANPDPDPAFPFNADPEPDPAFSLMLIRIQLPKLMHGSMWIRNPVFRYCLHLPP
jgi:hypothetical protein